MLINIFAEQVFAEEFLSNNINLFKRHSDVGNDIENILSIVGLLAVFGEDVMLKKIEVAEIKLWNHYESAKRKIENDDKKANFIGWKF